MRHLIALFYDLRYAVLRHIAPETAERLRHKQWWREACQEAGWDPTLADGCEPCRHEWHDVDDHLAVLDAQQVCAHCGTHRVDPDYLDAQEEDRLAALEAAAQPTDWVLGNHQRKLAAQRGRTAAAGPVPPACDGFEDEIPF